LEVTPSADTLKEWDDFCLAEEEAAKATAGGGVAAKATAVEAVVPTEASDPVPIAAALAAAAAAAESQAATQVSEAAIKAAPSDMSTTGHTTPMRGSATPQSTDAIIRSLSTRLASMSTKDIDGDATEHVPLSIMKDCNILGLGTEEHPYVIAIDSNHPERHAVLDVEKVQGMKHEGYSYEGYHIRTISFEPDFHNVTATMCDKYGGYADRMVLVSVASRSFFMNVLEPYHQMVTCPNTLSAHNITKKAVTEVGSARQKQWYLLVFPPGTALDNSIFSKNQTLTMAIAEMHIPAQLHGVVDDHHCLQCYWKIAVKNSGKDEGMAAAARRQRVVAA
jgi:hypothetical protein